MTERNKNGTFKKGKSGNKAGRIAGSGVTAELRKAILDKSPELLQMVIDKALEGGDVTAAMALLNKVMPSLKAANEPIQFTLAASKGLSGTGEQIVQSIADGSVPLDSGTQLLTSLASLAKLQEMDELTRRIGEKQMTLLKKRVEKLEQTLTPPGSV
ncbi:hypothetical protein BMR03_12085 [Methylococcaceae bacterium HT2]|nr:hypothetical protein BMR03_12085 [Methylococcaceae bacterium HT2]